MMNALRTTIGMNAVILMTTAIVMVGTVSAQTQIDPSKTAPIRHLAAITEPNLLNPPKIEATLKETVALQVGKTRLVSLPGPVRDVIVPNPKIVDVIIKRPTEVYLVAKAIGETNVFFVGQDGNVMLHAEAVVHIGLEGPKAALNAVFPNGGIHLNAVNKSIVISGTVGSAQASANAVGVVRTFVKSDTDVINMLRIIGDQQVLLKVRVAEIQRSVVKTLGSSLSFGSGGSGLATFGAAAGPAGKFFGATFASISGIGLDSGTITDLESRGLAKTLAEPALTSISGETANFLAGGEFPVPTGRDDNDNITIEFKKFGVSLSFTPVVLSKRQINLRIKTEVSRLDTSQELQLFGTTIPALTVRRADSTVSMTSGGSIMIAGMLQNDEFNDIEGSPWLQDIPILGALFASKGFQNKQTELVIMVTAYIARPTQPGTQLSLPTDGFVPADDFDFYLMGRLYKRYGKRVRPETMPMVRGPVGYLME
jgi:pilus assembly protein CpaC